MAGPLAAVAAVGKIAGKAAFTALKTGVKGVKAGAKAGKAAFSKVKPGGGASGGKAKNAFGSAKVLGKSLAQLADSAVSAGIQGDPQGDSDITKAAGQALRQGASEERQRRARAA